MAELIAEIDKQWTQFVDHDLPALVAAIAAEEWLQGADHAPRITPVTIGLPPNNAVAPVGV